MGNHEYYSGLERSLKALRNAGIVVLEDEAVKIGESFYLVGRKDRTAEERGGGRKPLAEIVNSCNPALPIILLDHQPVRLEEAEKAGIDLQLSGHTHNGQLFPFNLLNERFYEVNWGYLRKSKTHYFVSCGAGTWGPPIRTAGHSEVVRLRVTFGNGQ